MQFTTPHPDHDDSTFINSKGRKVPVHSWQDAVFGNSSLMMIRNPIGIPCHSSPWCCRQFKSKLK
ncbi:MAG: hypothetical protein H0X51_07185 [Parachlamydiaceae bacterium]|nr:hypothetical protein [Parachlamydiaceae bacterium]